MKASAANGKSIKIVLELQQTLKFSINGRTIFQLKKFLVIRDLVSDMNIGMKTLKELNANIDFKANVITINNKTIHMTKPSNCHYDNAPQHNELNELHAQFEDANLLDDVYADYNFIRLYNKNTCTIPPASMQILSLVPHKNDNRLKDNKNDLLITKDPIFTQNLFVSAEDTAITTSTSPMMMVYNPFNTDVKIKKGVRVATAVILEKEQQQLLKMYEEGYDVDNVNRYDTNYDLNQINNITTTPNDEHDDANVGHFATTDEDKRKYVINAFKLLGKEAIDSKKMERVIALLLKHWNTLDITGERVGNCTAIEHKIRLKDPTSEHHAKLRNYNPLLQDAIKEELHKWIKQGIIEKTSDSPPFLSALVPVIKSNGCLRLTVDYRKLNESCYRQNWSIPNIEETLASLSGNKIFSTLDCANAFNALPIEEQSKPLTSITTKWGNYQFNKIPYGMQGSSFSFAKAIAKILSHLPRTTAYPYIDDAILATKTFDEMLNNLE